MTDDSNNITSLDTIMEFFKVDRTGVVASIGEDLEISAFTLDGVEDKFGSSNTFEVDSTCDEER